MSWFGFLKPKLPVTEEERLWVDRSFVRLAGLLGRRRMTDAVLMLPTQECFPDRFDGSEAPLKAMFVRIARAMGVDAGTVQLDLFSDAASVTRGLAPLVADTSSGAGGLYFGGTGKLHISVHEEKLQDPLALVATLAHELGHVILLAPGLVARDEPDMEPLTDLLTVFLGFGVFNANAAFQFRQYTNNETQGWSTQRAGYLSEEVFGYALARFARERGERKPACAGHLSRNVASYFGRSAAWLAENEPAAGR